MVRSRRTVDCGFRDIAACNRAWLYSCPMSHWARRSPTASELFSAGTSTGLIPDLQIIWNIWTLHIFAEFQLVLVVLHLLWVEIWNLLTREFVTRRVMEWSFAPSSPVQSRGSRVLTAASGPKNTLPGDRKNDFLDFWHYTVWTFFRLLLVFILS